MRTYRFHSSSSTTSFALAVSVAVALMLAQAPEAGAEVRTLRGEGRCEKGHQTMLRVREGAKVVIYHLQDNDVSREFHDQVCAKPGQVKAVGDVREVNGRWELTATKLERVPGKENGPEK